MATYTSDQINKATTEGADLFVKSFYPALQSNRKTLASYYAQPTTSILFNGNPVANGTAVQEIFEKQMPPAHYERRKMAFLLRDHQQQQQQQLRQQQQQQQQQQQRIVQRQ
ncbi:hypothetical protein KEM54_003501 [Ascosphaera aggregata]|nr:hypothetical protein KEM54_003501 [Ascosphaera aggregata]